MNKNHEEAESATNAFKALAEEFGPDDVYNRIIIEELLKFLLGIKEEEKNGDK